jgi:hypothetical protein
VNVNAGTVPGTLRPGAANAVGTLTLGGGLTVASGARLSFHIGDGTTPADADTGGSTLGTLPDPTSNSFLNITGGTTMIGSGTVIVIDGTGATFTPGASYSFLVGQGAGGQSLAITDGGQFVLENFNASLATISFTGNATGNLYVNFTVVPVPEPAGLAAALVGTCLVWGTIRRRLKSGV